MGTGSYLPGEPVTNDELINRGIDTSNEWIAARTGMRARHFAAPGTRLSELALIAARQAIENASCTAAEIDLIIVATSTSDFIFPSTATLVQAGLGIKNGCADFDVQAVCCGFIYALATAEKFIRSGSHQRALVIGAEIFSNILDWTDHSTCVLFGDGTGAVVLEASSEPGVRALTLHADGTYHPSGALGPRQCCGRAGDGRPLFAHEWADGLQVCGKGAERGRPGGD